MLAPAAWSFPTALVLALIHLVKQEAQPSDFLFSPTSDLEWIRQLSASFALLHMGTVGQQICCMESAQGPASSAQALLTFTSCWVSAVNAKNQVQRRQGLTPASAKSCWDLLFLMLCFIFLGVLKQKIKAPRGSCQSHRLQTRDARPCWRPRHGAVSSLFLSLLAAGVSLHFLITCYLSCLHTLSLPTPVGTYCLLCLLSGSPSPLGAHLQVIFSSFTQCFAGHSIHTCSSGHCPCSFFPCALTELKHTDWSHSDVYTLHTTQPMTLVCGLTLLG